MRRLALPLGPMLLAACGPATQPAETVDNAAPPERQQPATPAAPSEAPGPAPPAEPPDDYPGVAGMSPSQRRAYERGWRDCRVGRYEPGEWAEAYRIGCAAAQQAE